jgi:hypothetical protein
LGQLLRPKEQQRQHKQNDTVLKTWHKKKSTKVLKKSNQQSLRPESLSPLGTF